MTHYSQASGAPGLSAYVLVDVEKLSPRPLKISSIKMPRTSRKNIETLRHVQARKEKNQNDNSRDGTAQVQKSQLQKGVYAEP
jgi:hypothetical protein